MRRSPLVGLNFKNSDVTYDVMFVLDTNVLVAGLFSRRGASFWLLERVVDGQLPIAISVALALEYECQTARNRDPLSAPKRDPFSLSSSGEARSPQRAQRVAAG